MSLVIALDAGTTGVRAVAIDGAGSPVGYSYREFTQHFPRPGWVEHDATEIWDAIVTVLHELLATLDEPVAAIGITNQRETVVAWDRRTGEPLHRAIVWQDRRTAARCDQLAAAGHTPLVRATTGLVLDPYFSGTKLAWLFTEGRHRAVGRRGGGHHRHLAALEAHGRRGARHRALERQPHDAVRHPCGSLVRAAVRPAGRPAGRAARGPTHQRALRHHLGRRPAPRASPSAASRATSRRRCSARRASSRA